MAEFGALNGEQQEQITRPFNEFNAAIERQKLIAVIRDTLRRNPAEPPRRMKVRNTRHPPSRNRASSMCPAAR